MKVLAVLLLVFMAVALWFFSQNRKRIDAKIWESSTPPWQTDNGSIYEHLLKHISTESGTLSDEGDALPDEDEVFDEDGLRWVSGGMDGAFGHHGGAVRSGNVAKKLYSFLQKIILRANHKALEDFYNQLKEGRALDPLDSFLEKVVADRELMSGDSLHDFSIWLATQAPHREAVKAGIALLGVSGLDKDKGILQTLGTHEEFTLFSVVALSNSADDPEMEIFELAKKVKSWGRIQAVERLADTNNAEIKKWLLREGYKNSVMYEYTAFTCATAGELLSEISEEKVDTELLNGAGDLIDTLITGEGGPAEGVRDYEDGAKVTEHLLEHYQDRELSLDQYLVVGTISSFLSREDDWADLEENGWTSALRAKLLEVCKSLLHQPRFKSLVEQALQSDDDVEFHAASRGAQLLELDIWDRYFQRVKAGKSGWYYLMQSNDEDRIKKVVSLAEEVIPLEQIATGVGDSLGMGPEFKHHGDLDFVLQDLRRFPGLGWKLINAGLNSPVVRNRNMSIMAIGKWGKDYWRDDTEAKLESLLKIEPNEHTKELIEKILAGIPIE